MIILSELSPAGLRWGSREDSQSSLRWLIYAILVHYRLERLPSIWACLTFYDASLSGGRRVARTKPTILQLFRTVFVLRLDFISSTVHTSTVVIFCDHNPRWYFVSPWVKVISPFGHFTVSGSIWVFYQTKEELHFYSKYFNHNQRNVISMSKQWCSKNIKSVCLLFRIPTIQCYNRLFITL